MWIYLNLFSNKADFVSKWESRTRIACLFSKKGEEIAVSANVSVSANVKALLFLPMLKLSPGEY